MDSTLYGLVFVDGLASGRGGNRGRNGGPTSTPNFERQVLVDISNKKLNFASGATSSAKWILPN